MSDSNYLNLPDVSGQDSHLSLQWKWLWIALAISLPCGMLIQPTRFYSVDWWNHAWLTGYYGLHLQQTDDFPMVIQPPPAGGMSYPVFYGYLLYPLLALFSSWMPAGIAIRMGVVLLTALQVFRIRALLGRFTRDERLPILAAGLVVGATYSLTNLYHRGALTEFFAVGFLTCALCSWFEYLLLDSPGERRGSLLLFALFFTLAAGSHAITAFFGSVFLLLLLPTLFLSMPAGQALQRLLGLCGAACLSLVVLAPWIYAVLRFGGSTDVGQRAVTGVLFFPDSLDLWWVRLFPLPLDVRTIGANPADVSTPFLDAQINLPLFLLAIILWWKTPRVAANQDQQIRARILLPVLLATGFFLAISISPFLFGFLPRPFSLMQFPYRMVAYVNLGLLALLILVAVQRHVKERMSGATLARLGAWTLGILALWATTGIVIKSVNVVRVRFRQPLDYAATCPSFYGHGDYHTANYAKMVSESEQARLIYTPLEVEVERNVGQTLPAVVSVKEDAVLATSIQSFPWNQLYLDGKRVPPEELRRWNQIAGESAPWTARDGRAAGCLAIPVPAGTHVIEYRFEPPATWLILHRVSQGALACWIAILSILALARKWKSGKEQANGSLAEPAGFSSGERSLAPAAVPEASERAA